MEKQVKIIYCVPCGYLERAKQMQQALEVNGYNVVLEGGEGGIFDIYAGPDLVFSRKQEGGRYPEASEILEKLEKRA